MFFKSLLEIEQYCGKMNWKNNSFGGDFMWERAYKLLKTWCDTLLTYQVSSEYPYLDGALLCPACHVVHGRIADLSFPLMLLYERTSEKRYLEAADKMIDWTEFNLKRPDGSWRNDAGNEWKCTSAFAAISIGDALLHFGSLLEKPVYEKWLKIFVRLSDFIYNAFPSLDPVINYYAGAACEQAMAWKITGDEKYLDFARDRERICRSRFDSEGLFFGEGHPIEGRTKKGCTYIDMGYALEESLPLLLRYAELTGEQKEFYEARFRDHLMFLLPDGGIDNSWGSRHNKWTWWGSRTSDGVLEGLALLTDDPMFCECSERVLSLYERCTHDGLLGLPMAKEAGEPTCLHHSFCHAKALAALILAEQPVYERVSIPVETLDGIRFYQNNCVAVISHNGWRATVSASDAQYLRNSENGGGSMTLLMHGNTPVCASTMRVYDPSELLNMQYLRNSDQTPCMTPRLVFEDGDSLLDGSVLLTKTAPYALLASGDGWQIEYSFDDAVKLRIETQKAAKFVLPVICAANPIIKPGSVSIGHITVKAEGLHCDPDARGFNQVGGFISQPIELPVNGCAEICICAE